MKKFVCKMKPEEVVKLLQEGNVIKDESDDEIEYKLINGLLYNSDTRCLSNSLFLDDDDLYFEVEDHFEIKKTGVYRTKNGSKVFIATITGNWTFGMIEDDVDVVNWNTNGEYFDRSETEFDIVSKWED